MQIKGNRYVLSISIVDKNDGVSIFISKILF